MSYLFFGGFTLGIFPWGNFDFDWSAWENCVFWELVKYFVVRWFDDFLTFKKGIGSELADDFATY